MRPLLCLEGSALPSRPSFRPSKVALQSRGLGFKVRQPEGKAWSLLGLSGPEKLLCHLSLHSGVGHGQWHQLPRASMTPLLLSKASASGQEGCASPVQSIPAIHITGHWGEDRVRKGHLTHDL